MGWKSQINTLQCVDNLKGMCRLSDECVDMMTTDLPYGYSFMGKDWDKAVPKVEVWKECLRVMKPGAFGFILCAPRQDCLSRMIVNLEDAGFEVNFSSIYWTYASGFPKAQNIGKAVDKRNARQAEQYRELGRYLRKMRADKPQKEIAKYFPSKTGGLTGCVANWELGFNVPTKAQWKILKKELNLDNRFDELIEREEAEREITGKGGMWGVSTHFGTGKSEWDEKNKPATPQAKALDGSYAGFQPKPAVEVVICVMKPLSEKTFVDQALKNEKGVTWLDNCRIPYEGKGDEYHRENTTGGNQFNGTKREYAFRHSSSQGRFPANLLVQDDVLNDGRDYKTGNLNRRGGSEYWGLNGQDLNHKGSSSSFSRYFDLDRWFAERIKRLPESVRKTFPFLIVPKASKAEKNRGCENLPTKEWGQDSLTAGIDRRNTSNKNLAKLTKYKPHNFHPTVKPLKLMCYLITLGSRENDVVLDPYMGSWTTAVACKMLNRNFLGYDDNTEYCKIGEERIGVVENKLCLQENLI